jgi:ATPase subunit of ABC transporter with duplicated ATPase domains
MTPAGPAIVATGLRKSFGDNLVLDGVDLDVAEGTVFALLGPNGAGKTTIVDILDADPCRRRNPADRRPRPGHRRRRRPRRDR